MKDVDFLVIHSTDTSEALDLDARTIIEKHTNDKRNGGFGWNRPGFDYLVLQDGTLETIIPEDSPTEVDLWDISQGRYGITGNIKNLAYVGGRTLKEAWWKDTRTEEQTATLEAVIRFYTIRFPEIIIVGFNEIATKQDSDKPGFSVKEWLEERRFPSVISIKDCNMRTIITLGIGFWMGRQLYINHDKRVARARDGKLKQRLIAFLKEKDPKQTQIEKQANQLLGN